LAFNRRIPTTHGFFTQHYQQPGTRFETTGSLVGSTKMINDVDKVSEVDGSAHLTESPSWSTLPAISRPFINRLCFHLRTDEECADLANLAQVSTHFHTGVHEFMKRRDNQPGIKVVQLMKVEEGLFVVIELYPSNIPFYRLLDIESERFERFGDSSDPQLGVTLNGSEDPMIEQLSDLFSSPIKLSFVDEQANFTPDDLPLCANLLRNSIISHLSLQIERLDDNAVPSILSLASHIKDFDAIFPTVQLSDPSSFITQLASVVSSSILMDRSSTASSFLGLPHSFWKKYLNEKLANDSFEFIETGNIDRKITKAPFNLPDTNIRWLEWHKKK
ncbi:hypothetical protein PMAYCL1PPCAC_01648, partial [Pristionchus mayeri]